MYKSIFVQALYNKIPLFKIDMTARIIYNISALFKISRIKRRGIVQELRKESQQDCDELTGSSSLPGGRQVTLVKTKKNVG